MPPSSASKPAGRRQSPVVNRILLGVLCLFLGLLTFLFIAASATFDATYRGATWSDLGALAIMVSVFPVLGAICCILVLVLLIRRTYTVFASVAIVGALARGCPLPSLPLAEGMSPISARLLMPFKEPIIETPAPVARYPVAVRTTPRQASATTGPASTTSEANRVAHAALMAEYQARAAQLAEEAKQLEEATTKHYDALTAQFASTQVIERGEGNRILLEDHKVLILYGVYYTPQMKDDLTKYVNEQLAHRRVTIRLPDREAFLKQYRAVAGQDGIQYGPIPCFVYVDGQLLNARYNGGAP